MVVIFKGLNQVQSQAMDWSSLTIEEHVQIQIDQGLNKKEATKKVAKLRNLPKQEVYKRVIEL